MRIVYITSLSRSGSTILDYTLGRHPDVIGLGEVYKVVHLSKERLESNELDSRVCSCGDAAWKCSFWGDVLTHFKNHPGMTEMERYKYITARFSDLYSDELVMVDSSKGRFDFVAGIAAETNIQFLHLIRDLRGWYYSKISNGAKNRIKVVLEWAFGNRRRINFYKDVGELQTFGYDELAIDPNKILKMIFDFCNLPVFTLEDLPKDSKSHILFGNSTSGDTEKRKHIIYDHRWLSKPNFFIAGCLILPLFKNLNKTVYSKIGQESLFAPERKKQIRALIR